MNKFEKAFRAGAADNKAGKVKVYRVGKDEIDVIIEK